MVQMKKISLPNLVAKDAERARKVAIVNVLVSDAKMLDSALISVSVKMKAMVARVDMDDTWAFLSRRTK